MKKQAIKTLRDWIIICPEERRGHFTFSSKAAAKRFLKFFKEKHQHGEHDLRPCLVTYEITEPKKR